MTLRYDVDLISRGSRRTVQQSYTDITAAISAVGGSLDISRATITEYDTGDGLWLKRWFFTGRKITDFLISPHQLDRDIQARGG